MTCGRTPAPTMHNDHQRLTFVLEKVSSLRHEFRNEQGFFTCFTFVAGPVRQVEFALPGRHEVATGMQITVVLSQAGDWGTVEAWRFDATGEIVMRLRPTAALIYLALLMAASAIALSFVIGEWLRNGATDWPRTIASFIFGALAGGMYFDWRNSQAVIELLNAQQ